MQKTDLRHSNNRKANRDLNNELDLWIAYKSNGEQPILLMRGQSNSFVLELYYAPNKFGPYWVKGVGFDWNANYETIRAAKYRVNHAISGVKWHKA